jgi:hypothetical protein
MDAEGWHLDPYKLHTDRWISNGRPTKLVRDDGVESYDPPPDEPFTGELVKSPTHEGNGGDLTRAGDTGEHGEGDPSKGLWEQGLSMWSDYYESGRKAD